MSQRGRAVFEHSACALCHTIRGTRTPADVSGPISPTSASRATTRGGDASEIPGQPCRLDRQSAGAQARHAHAGAPARTASELHAVVAYLETLR